MPLPLDALPVDAVSPSPRYLGHNVPQGSDRARPLVLPAPLYFLLLLIFPFFLLLFLLILPFLLLFLFLSLLLFLPAAFLLLLLLLLILGRFLCRSPAAARQRGYRDEEGGE